MKKYLSLGCRSLLFALQNLLNNPNSIVFPLIFSSVFFFGAISNVKAQGCVPGGPPQLSAQTASGFREITLTWTGVSGSNGSYQIYGSPDGGSTWASVTVPVATGETKQYTTNAWGPNLFMQTFQTYTFYVRTSICGTGTNSNTASAMTRDIATPSMTVATGVQFEEVSQVLNGVDGIAGYGMHTVYGLEEGAATWRAIQYSLPGSTPTPITIGSWGYNSPLRTYKNYQFYLEACTNSGTYCKQSAIVSATTRDIDAPVLEITQTSDSKAQLTWNKVNGGSSYYVYVFSTAQNQWNFYANVNSPGTTITYTDPAPAFIQIRFYKVSANRQTRERYSNGVSTGFFADQNNGNTTCNMAKGEPVNLSNGNMYINQTDYFLPGSVESIAITRTYNSAIQLSGLFGFGWTSPVDVNIQQIDEYGLRYLLSDGRAVYFGRTDTSQPFLPSTAGFYGQILKNADNTFTVSLKDGRVEKFGATGKLLWHRDRNGNQTTQNYDGNGNLASITDPFGRVLSFSLNANGTLAQISDSIGIVATYEYFPSTTLLKTVTYPDGSKNKFEYTTINSKTYVATVKDALENILETHQY